MPKRPSAIAFAPNDQHILCGDKFGDVYALPLDPGAQHGAVKKKKRDVNLSVPAATNLTVHSARNLRALDNQQRMIDKKTARDIDKKEGVQKTGSTPAVQQEPELGHVSMLTDLLSVRREVEVESSTASGQTTARLRKRDYIITSDRDEHIRISRGLPQAHIIENFCLGHTQFVSKMCLVRPDLLVSGSGDDFLCLWDWINGRLLGRIELRALLRDPKAMAGSKIEDNTPIAVSGIWAVPQGARLDPPVTTFVCGLEGMSAFFQFSTASHPNSVEMLDYPVGTIHHAEVGYGFNGTCQQIGGNLLDAAVLPGAIVVSMDTVHEPNTTTRIRDEDVAVGSPARIGRYTC